jgi:hypothetical protein
VVSRFLPWLRGLWGYRDDTQDAPGVEEPGWIRMEEPHGG